LRRPPKTKNQKPKTENRKQKTENRPQMFDRRLVQNFDWLLLGLVFAITAMGLVNLYSAGYNRGEGTPLYIKQLYWLAVGLALNPSLEGETTTTYLAQELKPLEVKVTRIAYGLPMGGDIKYADHQTLRESLSHRVET